MRARSWALAYALLFSLEGCDRRLTQYNPVGNHSSEKDSALAPGDVDTKVETADLSLTHESEVDVVTTNELFGYTITINNRSEQTAKEVVLEETPPDGVEIAEVEADGWSCQRDDRKLLCRTAAIAGDSETRIHFHARAPKVGGLLVDGETILTGENLRQGPVQKTNALSVSILYQGKNLSDLLMPYPLTEVRAVVTGLLQGTTSWINPAPGSNRHIRSFADAVHRQLLGRPATESEQVLYFGQINTEGRSRESVAQTIWLLEENLTKLAETHAQIFFERSPTATERQELMQILADSTAEKDLLPHLVSSEDFLKLYATPHSFVFGVFQTLLKLAPMASAAQRWEAALTHDSAETVATDILLSEEILRPMIQKTFTYILKRPPSPSEETEWLKRLQNKEISINRMKIALLGSEEFFALVFDLI